VSIISRMVFQNPWWGDKNKIYEDDVIRRVINSPYRIPPVQENILLLGPRQVGKTSFLKTTIMKILENEDPKKVLFFSCEPLRDKDDLIELIHEYRNTINPDDGYIFLDEITFVKDWNVGLLHLFNAGYFRNSIVYVTGSTSMYLMKETLPGRPLKKLVFYPLNFRMYFNIFFRKRLNAKVNLFDLKDTYEKGKELLPYLQELNTALLRYAERGGFFATNLIDNPLELYGVYKDATLSDIAKLGRDERIFTDIMGEIVDFLGSRISENTIAKKTSIGSHNTVKNYLELGEKLFILRIFRKIENGRFNNKSFKKVYFIDPFLFRVMKKYTRGTADISREELPRVVEGIVGEHLAREYEVGYTFTKSGKEVDFIVRNFGIEVKYGSANYSDLRVNEGYILSLDEIGMRENKVIMPISIFLYLISSEKVFYEMF
jgi:predicted AAA+ superfamily ATPase